MSTLQHARAIRDRLLLVGVVTQLCSIGVFCPHMWTCLVFPLFRTGGHTARRVLTEISQVPFIFFQHLLLFAAVRGAQGPEIC